MYIDIPTTLTARLNSVSDEYPYQDLTHYEVIVSFGNEEVTRLPTNTSTAAYSYYQDDEGRELLIQETVAKWLRERLT